jgi:hypothetical protein
MTCGHSRMRHLRNETNRPSKHFCDTCANMYLNRLPPETNADYLWHNFEDNLDYIERLAKEKGLV